MVMGRGGEQDRASMAALYCKSHLVFLLLFFFCFYLSPSHLLHSRSVFAPFSPPHILPPLFTLSSLQEVLELAFSVLYESDEYLNFIAPDKHEVS